jgi:hypothetical protein
VHTLPSGNGILLLLVMDSHTSVRALALFSLIESFLSPGHVQQLDENLMKQAQHISEKVNNRNHKAFEVPISSQMHDLFKLK